MDIFFTTVVRNAPLEDGGELVGVNWETKQILGKMPLVPDNPSFVDPNPRGNGRGGRGILKIGDLLYVALYHKILLFNKGLGKIGEIGNELFVGLHEMCAIDGAIWAASTAIDGAISFDSKGRLLDHWWPRENIKLQKRFGIKPLNIDKSIDNRLLWLQTKEQKGSSHTHLNAVAFLDNQLHVLLNRFGLVYNTYTNAVVIDDPKIAGCHNLVFVGDLILINDSHGKRMMVYNIDGRFIREINLLSFPEVKTIYNQVLRTSSGVKRPLFVRGLCHISGTRVLVGFSPATVVEIDLKSGQLLDMFCYSHDVAVCVHGLTIWN